MAGPKADKLTKERRVEAVYRLMLDGWNVEQIRANTAEWGLGPAQIGRYMKEARRRFEEGSALSRAELLAEHIAARRQLRREAKGARDKLAVLKDEAELLGLYPAKRTELTGAAGGPVQVQNDDGHTDEQRREKLAALSRIAAFLAEGGERGAGNGASDDSAG